MILLTDFRGLEEAAVAEDLVDLHLLFVEEDVQADLQGAERREQVDAHEVGEREAAFGRAHEQRAALGQVRDVLAGKVVVGQQAARPRRHRLSACR